MHQRTFRWMGLSLTAMIAAGCALNPLDDISPSPGDPDDEQDASVRRDAGTTKPRAGAGGMGGTGGMRSEAGTRAGAGGSDAPVACHPPTGAECDPVGACGCGAGKRCEVRPLPPNADGSLRADVARCFTDSGGKRAADAFCESDAECAAGLTCGGGICRRYCKSDADCDGEACAPGADAGGQRVEGLKFCLTYCNPAVPGTCEDSVCQPTTRAIWPNAFCYGLFSGSQASEESQPRFAVCDTAGERFPSCDDGLICIGGDTSEHGHCLPYCRNDADCPTAVPTCMKDGSSWADATTEIGFCYTNACTDYSVFEPEPYTGLPPWTSAQYDACTAQCGSDLTCQTANCPNAVAFQDCVNQAQIACVGALDGPCRKQYVALNCCAPCQDAADFLTCAAQMCAADYQAWSTCLLDRECAGTTLDACVAL